VSDTESIYTKVLKIIAGRYDRTFTWDLKVKMMGKNHQESSRVFIGLWFIFFVTVHCSYRAQLW